MAHHVGGAVHPALRPVIPSATREAAKLATEAEPKAAGSGAGSRYVEVRAEAFAELLGPLGFAREAPEVEARACQEVWGLRVPSGAATVLVYSTVSPGSDAARGLGEDSIRVALVAEVDGSRRALLPKEAWVCRTRGWRVSLLDRIEGVLQAAAVIPACSRCGLPMARRKGKRGEFFSCLGWRPGNAGCNGTKEIAP